MKGKPGRYGLALVVAVLMSLATTGAASIEGLQMVGHGLPPDSLAQDPGSATDCSYTTSPASTLSFYTPYITDGRARRDIDLLVSSTLTGAWQVTQEEVDELMTAFDIEHDNSLGVEETDLQLVFNYLSYSDPYDADDGFEVFPTCPETTKPKRNHIDFYLVKLWTDASGGQYSSAIPWNPLRRIATHMVSSRRIAARGTRLVPSGLAT